MVIQNICPSLLNISDPPVKIKTHKLGSSFSFPLHHCRRDRTETFEYCDVCPLDWNLGGGINQARQRDRSNPHRNPLPPAPPPPQVQPRSRRGHTHRPPGWAGTGRSMPTPRSTNTNVSTNDRQGGEWNHGNERMRDSPPTGSWSAPTMPASTSINSIGSARRSSRLRHVTSLANTVEADTRSDGGGA
jgi:hypothetical protein